MQVVYLGSSVGSAERSGEMGQGKEKSQERVCESAADYCWQIELKPLRDSDLS